MAERSDMVVAKRLADGALAQAEDWAVGETTAATCSDGPPRTRAATPPSQGMRVSYLVRLSEEEIMRTTGTKGPECHCKVPPIDRHPLRSDPAEERKAGCAISGGAS